MSGMLGSRRKLKQCGICGKLGNATTIRRILISVPAGTGTCYVELGRICASHAELIRNTCYKHNTNMGYIPSNDIQNTVSPKGQEKNMNKATRLDIVSKLAVSNAALADVMADFESMDASAVKVAIRTARETMAQVTQIVLADDRTQETTA